MDIEEGCEDEGNEKEGVEVMADSEVPTSLLGRRVGEGKGPMAGFMATARNARRIVTGS